MTIRTSLTGNGTWTQIGTGPATVQVISPASGVTVMVVAETSAPATNSDGLAMGPQLPVQHFSLAQAIWAQVEQTGLTALVAVQPETT